MCGTPSVARSLFAAIGTSQKTHLRVRGDHHGRALAKGEELGRNIAGAKVRDWLREQFLDRHRGDLCVLFHIAGAGPSELCFAYLIKRSNPAHTVRVFEQNRPDVTFGFGVVLSGRALQFLSVGSPDVVERLERHHGALVEPTYRASRRARGGRRELLFGDRAADAACRAAGDLPPRPALSSTLNTARRTRRS